MLRWSLIIEACGAKIDLVQQSLFCIFRKNILGHNPQYNSIGAAHKESECKKIELSSGKEKFVDVWNNCFPVGYISG